MEDELIKRLDQAADEINAEALKSTAQLLAEADDDVLTEDGLLILVERGYRDVLLRRCFNAEEREIIWYEWLMQQLAKQVIERGTPTTKEEMEDSFVQIEAKAVILAHCEQQPPSADLLSHFTEHLLADQDEEE